MFTLIHVSPHSLIASYPITRYWLPLWGFESGKCSMVRNQSVGTKKKHREYLTFRFGSKLFCQAADCSVAHHTFRSRIKLFGRASNFPVGPQTFRSGFKVCIIYHRLPTFCRFLLSGFLSFCLPVPPSQFLSKSGEAPISSD